MSERQRIEVGPIDGEPRTFNVGHEPTLLDEILFYATLSVVIAFPFIMFWVMLS